MSTSYADMMVTSSLGDSKFAGVLNQDSIFGPQVHASKKRVKGLVRRFNFN
uniref:Uncharacterized protein n=1 Tax=Solanum tuberosum TaxID=4113 RepID=M1ALA9_SOLTU